MRVAILTLGSTGDLMPFVWLARRLYQLLAVWTA